jgi:hypothetical protein
MLHRMQSAVLLPFVEYGAACHPGTTVICPGTIAATSRLPWDM